jgi:hypothetical protein
MVESRDLIGDTTLFTEFLSGESRTVDSEIAEDWKNYRLLQETEGYDLCYIHNADEIGLFSSLQHSKTLIFQVEFFHGGKNLNSGLL